MRYQDKVANAYNQHPGGHKMWKNLVSRALSDGHYAYHYDGDMKKLHRISKDTLDVHHKSYFFNSLDPRGHLHHLVISKTPLSI